MSRSSEIQIKDVWGWTNGGRDIFEKELGELTFTTNIKAPWRTDDAPSLRFRLDKAGIIRYTDYGGDQSNGSALDFLMKLYDKSLPQVIEMVKKEYIEGKPPECKKSFTESEHFVKDPVIYEFNDMSFTKEHHKYWNQYELTEDFVTKEGDIYAIKIMACNKKVIPFTPGEIAFGFVYRDETGEDTGLRKILRIGPEIEKKDKWRTNVPNIKLWYTYKYVGKVIPQLFIVKSNKDSLCNMRFSIPSVATQSENDIILAKNIPYLRTICPNLVLNFGSDPQGTQASINVSKQFQLPWFNTPKSYLRDGINDNAEYIKEFGGECYKQLLKNKKYLNEKVADRI